jgi:NADH dehydrogenase FAD-containing subunit
MSKKSVVIIGGGLGGTSIARNLSPKLPADKYELTIINPRPFAIWLPAMIRVSTTENNDIGDKALLPYTHLFQQNGTVVEGEVKTIKKETTGGSVVLDNGKEIKFDVLVLATGSIWEGPLKFGKTKEEIDEKLKAEREEIARATNIVLVGGGAVGIEFAGEIKDVFPDKSVTIVHGEPKLLNAAYPEKFRNKAEQDVRARGVKLELREYIDNVEIKNGAVMTRSGKSITADLVIPTRGGRPNTALLNTLGEGTLTVTGHVKVTKSFQLPAHKDIFAIGDIVDIQEQKQAAKVKAHADIVAENVLLVLGERPGELKEYKGSSELIVITNGRNGGVSYFGILWGLVFGGWLTKMLKSKSLLVPMGRKGVGLTD